MAPYTTLVMHRQEQAAKDAAGATPPAAAGSSGAGGGGDTGSMRFCADEAFTGWTSASQPRLN